jgi:hypothetical protein
MRLFVLGRPFTGSISEGGPRITSLDPVAGTLGINNEAYVVGTFKVIAGFSKIFPLPLGTRSVVEVGADVVASGHLLARGLHWGYARASLFLNIKAMGLNVFNMPNNDDHERRGLILDQGAGWYYTSPGIEFFSGTFLRNVMGPFTPASTTRRYLLSATIESWAGCAGYASWAIANITDGTTLESLFITIDP